MGAVGLAMFTVWFAINHSGVSIDTMSAEDYELLEGRESLDGQLGERAVSDDVKHDSR